MAGYDLSTWTSGSRGLGTSKKRSYGLGVKKGVDENGNEIEIPIGGVNSPGMGAFSLYSAPSTSMGFGERASRPGAYNYYTPDEGYKILSDAEMQDQKERDIKAALYRESVSGGQVAPKPEALAAYGIPAPAVSPYMPKYFAGGSAYDASLKDRQGNPYTGDPKAIRQLGEAEKPIAPGDAKPVQIGDRMMLVRPDGSTVDVGPAPPAGKSGRTIVKGPDIINADGSITPTLIDKDNGGTIIPLDVPGEGTQLLKPGITSATPQQQKELAAIGGIRKVVDQIRQGFDEKYVGKLDQYMGRITQGRDPKEAVFRAAVGDVSDMLLRARSGAQINEQEYNRLAAVLPGLGNWTGTEFNAKLNRFAETLDAIEAEKKAMMNPSYLKQQTGTASGSVKKEPAKIGRFTVEVE